MAPKTGGAAYTADRPTAVTCPEACERLYRGLFDSVPTSIWEEDASEVKAYLEDLMRSGAGDLRTYFDYHPEEVARCAAKVRVLSVNAATVAVYEAPDEKALLANIDKVLCEESYDVLKQVLIAVAEGRTEFEAEAFNRTFTGKKKHFRMRWLVAPGFEETYERIWVSMTDLTEHEHFARELDDTGRRYSTLTQHVQDVIWTMDMGLNLTFISPSVESLLGYKPEEVAGKHYRELLTPESLEVVVAALAEELAPEAMRTKDPHRSRVLELEFRTRAGHTLWGELNISFMLNSENIPAGIVGVIRDITDRRGTRQALERSLQAQKAINDLLQISLEHVSTGEMLERMVARIVAMPWFSTHARGEVLLVDSATGALALRAESGPAVVSAAPCAGMKMGGRLCEKAAAHADAARGGAGGEDNLLLCRSGTAQSRYCVPLSTAGKPLGALTLCLAPGRVLGDKETEFLQAAGRVLAGSIERMEAAKTLRRSEADYHAIFDNASDCIFLHDPETARILDVNRKTCEMFGYSREEMLRLSVADISAGERAAVDEAALARLRNAARKGSELFEWLCKDRSGRVFWVEVNLSYARLGSAERVIAFVRDVDARKRAELRVLALGRFLEGMMDALGIWITASDTDGNILVWNAAAEAISGYSREEVLGNNSVWERLFPAGGEDAGAVRRCVDGSGGESRCDHCRSSIVTRDGASRLIHWNFFGLSVDDGRPCGTVTLAFDVSGGAGDSGGGPDLKREIVEALRSCA